jgi:hypothetical protein
MVHDRSSVLYLKSDNSNFYRVHILRLQLKWVCVDIAYYILVIHGCKNLVTDYLVYLLITSDFSYLTLSIVLITYPLINQLGKIRATLSCPPEESSSKREVGCDTHANRWS